MSAILCVSYLALPVTVVRAQVDFDSQVQPIFERHCLECHSQDQSNGGLDFSSLQSLFSEADSGQQAVVAGAPEKSELLRRILTDSEDERMPPEGKRLSDADVQQIKDWIRSGASVPAQPEAASMSKTADSEHWSFQPIRTPAVPMVEEIEWCWSPIDRFVLSRQRSMDLKVVGDADESSLVRRVFYDLCGLPPSMADVRNFSARAQEVGRQAAFAEMVDECLAKDSYGERWGRHWMDWVRYADTAGCNSDFPIPQAYLYRNYIIDSLNGDVPYDRFVVEQLAGDLLPANDQAERNRLAVATGYLAMARRFGSLVETYPWHLTIEDTIDNVGKTMLGLTLACARCHDHKFDPVSTRDYYGLYGIFASTQYAFPGIELFQVQHDMIPLLSQEEVAEKLGDKATQTQELVAKLESELKKCRERELQNAERFASLTVEEQRKQYDELQAMLGKARNAGKKLAEHLKSLPALPVAYGVRDAEPQAARIQIKGEPTRLGATVPRKFPDILGGQRVENEEASGRLELAEWIASSDNPLTARVIVNRVWQRHFGKGLVESTSDFGLRGQEPSHPDLLDWLAADFMQHGWSLKHLHRRIMNARIYQLASTVEPEAFDRNLTSDPTNRYYWKFNRLRLDAESIRDTLLTLSEQLDPEPQTEPYPIPPQKDWTYTQHHPFKDDYENKKRSVYQMTKRLTVEEYMQTFDGPDPNVCTNRRDQSVTALQALYFVNDEFLHDQAQAIAALLVERAENDAALPELAVQLVLSREAEDHEVQMLLEHYESVVERQTQASENEDAAAIRLEAWASCIRALLRLNEFVYVD